MVNKFMSNLESIALLVLLDGVPELLSMLGQSNDADNVSAAIALIRSQSVDSASLSFADLQ